ncbi:LLM class flavin-dependent oxidoreductase [Conexibacter sp. SYSU D00693]|uniref:LLM class flavin-dependent oxidoreductase n=1 Tax=Conexibacter sp. SYSU D00693 TaxID=2812560 RepID=UPI00196AEBC3|nr:LLM class flavin-dependent oxidoreductase [Conexibacter sp. SYSU D00693]
MPERRTALTLPFAGVPLTEHPALLREAERLGFHDVWSGETANGTDGFTPLAQAAVVTERLRLVTGIVNPYTRGPGLLAQSAAALQELSGGRFVLGLGASSDVIVERFNGGEFRKPLTKMRETVEALRPVLSGEGRGFGGLKLERPVTTPVPIVLAALRGKMLQLAADQADGAFTNFLPLRGARQVAGAFGRPDKELACRFFLLPSEDLAPLARQMFAAYVSVGVYRAFFEWLGCDEIGPMADAWATGDRARAVELVPDDLLRDVFLVGPVEHLRERLDAFAEAGITTAVLTFIAPPDQLPGLLEAFAPGRD